MAVDFTVIQHVRQRFGDQRLEYEVPEETEAPFVGYAKEFPFACPDVDPSEMAVLQLESLGLTADEESWQSFTGPYIEHRNMLTINKAIIPGGLTPAPSNTGPTPSSIQHFWKAHSLLVLPNVLQEQNVLYIESAEMRTGQGVQRDNFIIDNVVIFFKTGARKLIDDDVPPIEGDVQG